MPTRNVVLSDHLASLVVRLVESGRYQNASEVMREGLRLVERQEMEHEIYLKAMREASEAWHRRHRGRPLPVVRYCRGTAPELVFSHRRNVKRQLIQRRQDVIAKSRRWRVRLAAAAENDFRNILRWTSEHFGEGQAHAYAETCNFSITPCTPFGIGVMSGRDQRSRAVGVAHVRPAIHQRPMAGGGLAMASPLAAGSSVKKAACTGLLRSYRDFDPCDRIVGGRAGGFPIAETRRNR